MSAYLAGAAVPFSASPVTPGYTAGDHDCDWTFDDGGTATGQSVTHAFSAPGSHTATVTARCRATGKTATATVSVEIQIPAPVIGSKVYTLKLAQIATYPSAGYTAEVQVRDLSDRVNHTFQRHCKLDNLLANGAISAGSLRCWLFVKDGKIHINTVSETTGHVRIGYPKRVAVYRLDGIDANQVGIFTLVASDSLADVVGANNYSSPYPLYIQTSNYLGTYAEYAKGYADNLQKTSTSATVHTFDVPGGRDLEVFSRNLSTSRLFITPFDAGLGHLSVTSSETLQGHVVRQASYSPVTYESVIAPYVRISLGGISPDPTYHQGGFDWTLPGDLGIGGPATTFSRPSGYHLPRLGAAGAGINFAHPAGLNPYCPCAVVWGDMVTGGYDDSSASGLVYHYLARADGQARAMPAITNSLTGADRVVGIWGDAAALVVWRTGSFDLAYDNFYAIRSDDASAAKKRSIFSALAGDGAILHIVGIEAVTPELWRDDTKLADLN